MKFNCCSRANTSELQKKFTQCNVTCTLFSMPNFVCTRVGLRALHGPMRVCYPFQHIMILSEFAAEEKFLIDDGLVGGLVRKKPCTNDKIILQCLQASTYALLVLGDGVPVSTNCVQPFRIPSVKIWILVEKKSTRAMQRSRLRRNTSTQKKNLDALRERRRISAAASAGVRLLLWGVAVSELIDLSGSCVLLPGNGVLCVSRKKRGRLVSDHGWNNSGPIVEPIVDNSTQRDIAIQKGAVHADMCITKAVKAWVLRFLLVLVYFSIKEFVDLKRGLKRAISRQHA